MESVHHLMKVVAGAPNIRPPWFFDTAEQGEGLNDIGTHLVDLVQWTLFPEQAIDYRRDVRVLAAQRWPTWIPEEDFRRVTAEPRFPAAPLAGSVKDGKLEYFCNTLVSLHAARHSHEVERDLGLGGARRVRRHALRVLPRHARTRRGAADARRSVTCPSSTWCRLAAVKAQVLAAVRATDRRRCSASIPASASRSAAPRSTSRSPMRCEWATRRTSLR